MVVGNLFGRRKMDESLLDLEDSGGNFCYTNYCQLLDLLNTQFILDRKTLKVICGLEQISKNSCLK